MKIQILGNIYLLPIEPVGKDQHKSGAPAAGISKKKPKKNKILISSSTMVPYLAFPQPIAAKKLNVSLSTLKRRFSEVCSSEKWPANQCLSEFNFGERNRVAAQFGFHSGNSKLKLSMGFYTTYKDATMEQKSQLGTLLNEYNTKDEVHLDPMTISILYEAFKQHEVA